MTQGTVAPPLTEQQKPASGVWLVTGVTPGAIRGSLPNTTCFCDASTPEHSWIRCCLSTVYYFKEEKHEFADPPFFISAGLWFELDLGAD